MNGKTAVFAILSCSLIAGFGLYYLQVYHFYEELAPETQVVELVSVSTGGLEEIIADDIQAIDGSSSPIRYRACFTTLMDFALLTESYELAENPIPNTAPDWFDCFDALEIGAALEDGTALGFASSENIGYGVDRVVAIFDDGRGFVWHQLNNCGRKAYDGTPVGEECPARDITPEEE